MNHPFDLDNFESFLSEQADQHRMYAGDRVWRNIQENLHGKDRWPALTFGAILTTAVMAVVLTFTYPQKRNLSQPADYSGITAVVLANKPVGASNRAGQIRENNPRTIVSQPELASIITPIFPGNFAGENRKSENQGTSGESTLVSALNNREENTAAMPANATLADYSGNTENAEKNTGTVTELGTTAFFAEEKIAQPDLPLLSAGPEKQEETGGVTRLDEERQHKIQGTQDEIAGKGFVNTTMAYGPKAPGKSITGKSRWSVQYYATPSISYRYLLENKTFKLDPAAVNGPIAPYLTNPASDFINQKPKLGLEAGTAFLYQITNNFRLKTGIQLNYRQFGLQAFTVNAQPAMLALNGANGPDSIIRFSSFSTQGGYRSVELSNSFFQVALPLGFDMKIADTRVVDFYVSAAGQLTYQVASSSYLLSADYKNYLRQPGLDRKFNINTAVEAFASFEAGGITWQAGPQIRYQVLPGSKNAYPIREHLIDYGFKLGVVKKLR